MPHLAPPPQLHAFLKDFHSFGNELIKATREVILNVLTSPEIGTEIKADNSPVTRADKEGELTVRRLVASRYPEHGVIGEEFGSTNPHAQVQWVIDPIDGTKSAVHGIPTFGTLLGLRINGEAVLGWIDHPALDVTVCGGVDTPLTIQGSGVVGEVLRRFSNRLVAPRLPRDAIIATGTFNTFERNGCGKNLLNLISNHPHTEIYYNCFAHTLLALGAVDGYAEYNLKVWDISALEAIARSCNIQFAFPVGRSPQQVYESSGSAGLADTSFCLVAGRGEIMSYLASLLR